MKQVRLFFVAMVALVGMAAVGHFASAQGISNPNFWKRIGNVVTLLNPAWTLGDASNRIDIFADDLNATTLTIGGVVTGDLMVNGQISASSSRINGTSTFIGFMDIYNRVSQTGLGSSTFFGFEAGKNDDLTENKNSGFGHQALKAATTGFENVMIGYQTGDAITTGNSNVGIGSPALNNLTTGQGNIAIGDDALGSAQSSIFSTAVGNAALSGTSDHSVALGNAALRNANTGDNNVGAGSNALVNLTTGDNNVGIGYFAGALQNDLTSLTTPANSVYIGPNARGFSNSDSNTIVIGSAAIGLGANTTVMGNTVTTKTLIYGNHSFYALGTTNVSTDDQIGTDSGVIGIPMFVHSAAGAAAIEGDSAATDGKTLFISSGDGGAGTVDFIGKSGGSLLISAGAAGANGGLGTGVAGQLFFRIGSTPLLTINATSTSISVTSTILGGLAVGTSTAQNAALYVGGSATTTQVYDSISATKGACQKFKDNDGSGYTYCSYTNGVQACSVNSCE